MRSPMKTSACHPFQTLVATGSTQDPNGTIWPLGDSLLLGAVSRFRPFVQHWRNNRTRPNYGRSLTPFSNGCGHKAKLVAQPKRRTQENCVYHAADSSSKWIGMTEAAANTRDKLNEPERKVLLLLAQGHTVKSIARQTGWTAPAVNERLRSARQKTGVGSSRELARLITQENEDTKIGLAGSSDQFLGSVDKLVHPQAD